MKTNKILIILAAIAMIFFWGCEKDIFSTIDQKVETRAKGGNKDDNKRGGKGDVTFDVNFDGDWTPDEDPTFISLEGAPDRKGIRVNGEVIQLKLVDVLKNTIDSASNCFHTIYLLNDYDSPQTPLTLGTERKTGRARLGLWFVGRDIYDDSFVPYVFYALGTRDGSWPPSGTNTTTLTFTRYKLSKGSGNYSNPCDSGGEKDLSCNNCIVKVTPTQAPQ